MDDSKLNSRNNSLVCRPFVDEKSSDLPVSVHIRACPLPSSQKNVKESFFLDKEKKKVCNFPKCIMRSLVSYFLNIDSI